LRITNAHSVSPRSPNVGVFNEQRCNKTYHIKYKNDIENNVNDDDHDDDDDDDPKKPNNKNYYLENTLYSATIILVIFIFIYFS